MQVDLSKAIEIVTYKDRRIERRDVTLMRQDDGAWRYEKKTRHMTDDMDSIYVVNAAARVKTGSPGWWMLDDGRWGAFTRTDGATLRQDLRIALFGMKLGE